MEFNSKQQSFFLIYWAGGEYDTSIQLCWKSVFRACIR